MTTRYSCILFDLDGTIIDSASGITASLAFTFEKLGLPVPSASQLLDFVGPPLLDSFAHRVGLSEAESHEALTIYRARYIEHGVLDADLYPGVFEIIQEIHAAGIPLSLATSKPESLARMALDHLGVTPYLDCFTGASEDEKRSLKADVVEVALQRLTAFGADISRPVLVGDRHYDVEGAAVHGVPTIAVDWGYGEESEFTDAIAVASTPEALRELLF